MQTLLSRHLAILATASLMAVYTSFPANAAHLASHGHQSHHRAGVTIKALPRGHKAVMVGNVRYFTHGGLYYRAHKGRYKVVAAPVGLTVTKLPRGFVTINLKSGRYFRAGNTYYQAAKHGFLIVARPKGIPITG